MPKFESFRMYLAGTGASSERQIDTAAMFSPVAPELVIKPFFSKGMLSNCDALDLQTNFTTLDRVIIVIYLAATVAIGLYANRYVTNMGDYIVAGQWTGMVPVQLPFGKCRGIGHDSNRKSPTKTTDTRLNSLLVVMFFLSLFLYPADG